MASQIKFSRPRLLVVGVAAVLLLVAAALIATRAANKHAKRTDPSNARDGGLPLPADFFTIADREIVEIVFVSARVASDSEPTLFAPRDGLVKKIHVSDGARVEAGAPLIEIDPTPLERDLATATAARATDLEKRDAARNELRRKESLAAQKLSSESDLETARLDLSEAELSLIKDQSEITRLQEDIEALFIRAPSRGIIRDIIDAGWTKVTAASSLVQFTSPESLGVLGTLPEEYIPLLTPGLKATVTLPSLPGLTATATLSPSLVPISDPATRSASVRFVLDTPDPRISPGLTATARIAFSATGPAVPLIALFNRAGRDASVFTVTDGVATLRKIRLGRIDADWAQVVEGLGPGDVIVQSGQLYLKNGDKVAEVK